MTLLALVAIIFFGFATYNLTCAFVDIPTKKTSRMMMLARKQQGVKAEKLLDVYITKIAGLIAPYLKLDKLKRNKLQRALDIAGLELTPEIYTARAWVTAGAVGLCSVLMVFLVLEAVVPDVVCGMGAHKRNPSPHCVVIFLEDLCVAIGKIEPPGAKDDGVRPSGGGMRSLAKQPVGERGGVRGDDVWHDVGNAAFRGLVGAHIGQPLAVKCVDIH